MKDKNGEKLYTIEEVQAHWEQLIEEQADILIHKLQSRQEHNILENV